MDIGMLWFDNDQQADLNIKVTRAVTYYQKKYGKKPNLCFVNPCMISTNGNGGEGSNGKVKTNNGIEIRGTDSLLPNHFWLGIERQSA